MPKSASERGFDVKTRNLLHKTASVKYPAVYALYVVKQTVIHSYILTSGQSKHKAIGLNKRPHRRHTRTVQSHSPAGADVHPIGLYIKPKMVAIDVP